MKFQVCKNQKCHMSTEYVNCIPIDSLDIMEKAGFYFIIDGKMMSADGVREYFKGDSEPERTDSTPDDGVESTVEDKSPTEDPKPSNSPDLVAEQPESTPQKPKKRTVRKIICIENGEVYESMSAAGRALNIDPAAISYAITKQRPTTSGYTFEFIPDGSAEVKIDDNSYTESGCV